VGVRYQIPMKIALVHDGVVPPAQYGGTERVLAWLAKGLLELGHSVVLISREGSQIAGAEWMPFSEDWAAHLPASVDLIHISSTPCAALPKPFLVTIHGNGQPGERFHANTVFLSKAHAALHGSQHFVYNGIDPNDYPCDPSRTDDLVFLAKASWKVKNLAGAIELARASGRPLHVLGSRDLPWKLQRWLPAWRGVRYHGMVDDHEKKQFLRRAHALLFPVRWPEPFGLAVTEALASGCAVLGTPYGSLPEIVTPEVGVLSDRADELLQALQSRSFSPQACRNRVLQGFTYLQMAERYLRLYQQVLTQGTLEGPTPVSKLKVRADRQPLPYASLAAR